MLIFVRIKASIIIDCVMMRLLIGIVNEIKIRRH